MFIGKNLRVLRKKKGWTQQELANRSGIKLTHISTLESSESDPKLSTLSRLIEALDCSPNELMTEEQKEGDAGFKASLRKAEALPEQDKAIIMDVIRKFVIADNARLLSLVGAPDDMVWETIREHHGLGRVEVKNGEMFAAADDPAAEAKAERDIEKIRLLGGDNY